jgi:hypothetical protein
VGRGLKSLPILVSKVTGTNSVVFRRSVQAVWVAYGPFRRNSSFDPVLDSDSALTGCLDLLRRYRTVPYFSNKLTFYRDKCNVQVNEYFYLI